MPPKSIPTSCSSGLVLVVAPGNLSKSILSRSMLLGGFSGVIEFCFFSGSPKLRLNSPNCSEMPPMAWSTVPESREPPSWLLIESGVSILFSVFEFQASSSVSGLDPLSRRFDESGALNVNSLDWTLSPMNGVWGFAVECVCESRVPFPSTWGTTMSVSSTLAKELPWTFST